MQFLFDYGGFIALCFTLLSDVVMWFRTRSKKTDTERYDALLKATEQLISVLKGDSEVKK